MPSGGSTRSKSRRLALACVHGVGVREVRYADAWAEVIEAETGFPVEATAIPWASTGSPTLDTVRLLSSPGFRAELESRFERAFAAWDALTDHPKLVVCHSAGTVVAGPIADRLGLPVLCVGSPVTHPILGRAFERAFGAPLGVVTLQNPQDGVASVRGAFREPALGWGVQWVDVAGTPTRWPGEHPAELYLETRAAQRLISEIFWRSP